MHFPNTQITDSAVAGWPASGPVTTRYGEPSDPIAGSHKHRGVDIGVFKTPIYQPVAGTVNFQQWGTFGWWVVIKADKQSDDEEQLYVVLAHMSQQKLDLQGTHQEAGTLLGVSGGVPGEPGAGTSTGAHIHFEVNDQPLIGALWENSRDPQLYCTTEEDMADMALQDRVEKLEQRLGETESLLAATMRVLCANGTAEGRARPDLAVQGLDAKNIELLLSVNNLNGELGKVKTFVKYTEEAS